jgi:hypothetical protein
VGLTYVELNGRGGTSGRFRMHFGGEELKECRLKGMCALTLSKVQ